MTETDSSTVLCHTIPAPDTGVCAYDDPDGLSRTVILALAQGTRGYLWIGTEGGPVRFDGMEWGTPAGLADLRTFDTWAFDTLDPHALWVGTNGAGLCLFDTQPVPYRRRATLTSSDGLADDDVHVLCRDVSRALWVGTHHGLAIVEGEQVRTAWTARDGIPEAGICALCADPAGGMWAGSLHGLLRFDQRTLRAHLTRQDGLPDDAIYALCTDSQGRLWAGTRDGIAILSDGRIDALLHDGLPSPEVRALCLDRSGRVWAGTARGLACIEQERVCATWTRAQHLPSSSVWSLLCDRENRLWVGTERGVALLPQQSAPIRTLPLCEETDGSVYSFASDRRSQTWIGTSGNLLTVAPDGETRTTPPALPSILRQAGVWAVHHDHAGRMWAAGRYGGLYCLDPATGATIAHVDAVNAARCMVDDPEGRLWVGTLGAGLACVDTDGGALLHRLTSAQGFPCDHVSSLCLDGRGRLWAGTFGGGIACVDRPRGAVVAVLGRAEGLPHLSVSGLALGPDGQLWGTTQEGLFRVDLACDRVSGVWSVNDGLPSDTLVSCAFDTQGALWLGSARGLARFLPATGACLALGRPHGLPGDCCQQGALQLDNQGRLWVGTIDGVALVTPRDMPQAVPECAVFLTGLRIMGQERGLVDGLEIEDSNYDLVIDYGAVTFVGAAQVMYRTQLAGLESDWSRPHQHRFARYTNLRPGSYTFRVSARNWGGQWSAPAEWRFRVIRDRRAEELECAQQRAELAEAAVHVRNDVLSVVAHDLRAPLTSIIGHADLLQLRLEGAAPPREWLHARAGALRDAARRMASMVDEIVDVAHLQMGQPPALQLESIDVGALVQASVCMLGENARGKPALEVDTPPGLVVMGDRARLERVVQNLIGNAIKYSPAAIPVRVSVRPDAGGVTITVQDSGVGIPASELAHIFTPFYRASTSQGLPGTGLGLAGTRTIVEQHGGRITLESRVGHGTTVTVSLPQHAPEQRAGCGQDQQDQECLPQTSGVPPV